MTKKETLQSKYVKHYNIIYGKNPKIVPKTIAELNSKLNFLHNNY